jgi:hypothetical protein
MQQEDAADIAKKSPPDLCQLDARTNIESVPLAESARRLAVLP